MVRQRISLHHPHNPTWSSGPVLEVTGPLQRLRGTRAVPAGHGVLLRTRSIHTVGLTRPLLVVSLGESLVVRSSAVVDPGCVVVDLGARWVLELPPTRSPPAAGMRLRRVGG
ncbi:MAG: hypothetical protein R3290_04640 [Acidimicrobiia bacterium]|nr:hypothetical protein [Acidimicrobiia bacterium]